jgi:hypothetical protein
VFIVAFQIPGGVSSVDPSPIALTQLNMADVAPLSVIVLLRQFNVGWWKPSMWENDSNDDD